MVAGNSRERRYVPMDVFLAACAIVSVIADGLYIAEKVSIKRKAAQKERPNRTSKRD